MSTSLCKTSVLRIYQEVIDDVISGVRELFLEDGVDEQVLQELKQTWETKLMSSKAVQNEQEEKVTKAEHVASNGFPKVVNKLQAVSQQPQQQLQPQISQIVETKLVPIQITLPPQPGTDGAQRVLTIQVPATALQGNQLHRVLTGPVITATMGLPPNIASTLLQQHVNAAFNSQQQAVTSVIQADGAKDDDSDEEITIEIIMSNNAKKRKDSKEKKTKKNKHNLIQTDGPMDTSDEDEDGSDDDNDDDDLDDDKDEDDQEMEDEGGEEEPLNSEDDVTDDDPTDLFDTDNIVVCQYDKIIRNRNKWKFYLKDGIMNLNGQDYVFQKANGDAEW
ncbi:transcription initiation factor IIA subunit 1-like [Anoplophora glabripennis]|uniref:transcription initiation factor IIA subunit 1-like n=1 Tax=Anoplophora glabripennis TaxID=217634 RepID=UPI0008754AC4|nr:transcription initiation factor IIA subunit 1-like [Anoplophora glabripennis]